MSHLRVISTPEPTAAQECEQAVIGAVLMANAAYWRAREAGLEVSDFAYPVHQRIWEAISEQLNAGMEVSPVSLAPRFQGDEALKDLGGHRYLASLSVNACPAQQVQSLVTVIMDWSKRRRLKALADELQTHALNGNASVEELLSGADETLNACRARGEKGGLKPMARVVESALASIERAHQRGKVDGVQTGLKAIDSHMGGLAKTDLIILAGRPGMGKSALAGTIFRNVATALLGSEEKDGAVAIFSPEMSDEQLAARMISDAAEIESGRLRLGNMGIGEFHRAVDAGRTVGGLPILIDDRPAIKPNDMRAALKNLARTRKIKLIGVDYLQLLEPDRSDGSRVNDIGGITRSLKTIAKEFDAPVLALSQLSRAVEQREDKRPQLSDLRESGSIEQDADVVLFLYRDEYYAHNEEPKNGSDEKIARWRTRCEDAAGKAELNVAKFRHGATGILRLAYEGRYTRFADLER